MGIASAGQFPVGVPATHMFVEESYYMEEPKHSQPPAIGIASNGQVDVPELGIHMLMAASYHMEESLHMQSPPAATSTASGGQEKVVPGVGVLPPEAWLAASQPA